MPGSERVGQRGSAVDAAVVDDQDLALAVSHRRENRARLVYDAFETRDFVVCGQRDGDPHVRRVYAGSRIWRLITVPALATLLGQGT